MENNIRERVIGLVAGAAKVEPGRVTLDTTFEELGMSSLDALSLIYDLEEEFNVAIPNDDAIAMRDVRQAVESLERLVAGKGAEGGAVPAV